MTFQSFNLTLDGGNAEMETRHHIGDALRAMALKMYHHANQSSPPLSGYIRDTNGNIIGEWIITPEVKEATHDTQAS